MAWSGRILDVDLGSGRCEAQPLNPEWRDQYLGLRGLATRYLMALGDPKADPLGPDNPLIFATGPLTGTGASTGGRYGVVTKGALTGAIACSNSGGRFGGELKLAGWDLVIVRGRSERPVWLLIEDDHARLLPADELWGQSVWETERRIHRQLMDHEVKVAAVGRAAERGCLISGVVNDGHRAAGRSGVGTVMAAKRLKAVAVRGSRGVSPVADRERFAAAIERGRRTLAASPMTGDTFPKFGTVMGMNLFNQVGILPTRNARQCTFEGADAIGAEAMRRPRASDGRPSLVTNAGCFACTIGCGRIQTIDPEHFTVRDKPQYQHASGGLEYEAAWALGADCGVADLDAVTYANFLCNEDGLDVLSFGATVAVAMELYEIGALTDADTDGLALHFGSAEALARCAELTARGEGLGRLIGLGSARLAAKFGHPELALTVKGQEIAAYDPRGAQGIGLGFATSNRGACHLRGYTIAAEIFGHPVKVDPLATEGKAALAKESQDFAAALDATGLCNFSSYGWTLGDIAEQVDAACGGGWDVERLMTAGERCWNLERLYNLRAGFTAADDTLPPRLLNEPAPDGPARGHVARLGEMLPEYYRVRGWGPDGVPLADTLARLGLTDV